MSYLSLLRTAWKSGDFKISQAAADEKDADPALSWRRVQDEMEDIIERESGTRGAASTSTGRQS